MNSRISLQIISSSHIPATILFGLVKDVGQVAATAVLAVVHGSHEAVSYTHLTLPTIYSV